MNTSNVKKYAPKARATFIAAVTKQATKYGITANGIAPLELKGDLALIGEHPFPAAIARPRAALAKQVEQQGFDQVMEQSAYTWFNRLCAIRFMELKGYLDHGRRVLSHPKLEGHFQILDDCLDIEFPDLDKKRIAELKLDGTKDEELYRELLLAQCHALYRAMPFLFEAIDDKTELLLPDNLTKTDSLIRELVDAVPEEDWQAIEVIGWLYQFYISEKKDRVIGKVVRSEDIPAATQLFTPNWIVKYMVQNSLGAQWLATYPESPIKAQMEYYITPAAQTPEVVAQLAAITPANLNPEELTLIDPASGSGHILVEAYDLFKAIYLERGYLQRNIPQLILEKNLFGLDIDERAAQLTGFALMMKGREDDRRLFDRGVKLNVMALVHSAGLDPEVFANSAKLTDYGLQLGDLIELQRLFEHAASFGSLIQVPEALKEKLPALKQFSGMACQDLFLSEELKRLEPLVLQATVLASKYDAVVANPPYMGRKGMNDVLKSYIEDNFPNATQNLSSAFTERFVSLTHSNGFIGMMTPSAWLFLSTYAPLRRLLSSSTTLTSLIEPEYHSFFDSAYVSVCTFVLQNAYAKSYLAKFISLDKFYGADLQSTKALEAINSSDCDWMFISGSNDFEKIPGIPVAYSSSKRILAVFTRATSLGKVVNAAVGLQTGKNEQFLRYWFEVSDIKIGVGLSDRESARRSGKKWFPYNKGGDFRRWWGNHLYVVNWENDGYEVRLFGTENGGRPRSVARNTELYFRAAITWSDITSGPPSFRFIPNGYIHDVKGMSAFSEEKHTLENVIAFCNTPIVKLAAKILNPGVNFQVGNFANLPYIQELENKLSTTISPIFRKLVDISKKDWNSYERSLEFKSFPIFIISNESVHTLESNYEAWIKQNCNTIAEMRCLEEENNRVFIDAYSLADELNSDVPVEQISLTINPAYRYGGKLNEAEKWTRFREDTSAELVSYAIGCAMGRYSLDEPGLIYANSGNEGFDPTRYIRFPADHDGIIPLTDNEWFSDDVANRLVEFMSVAWDASKLEENLAFLANNLSPKKGEGSRDTIRRYLCDSFYKDHLQTYKKRPIYWLFSSGKQKAFQCLVYLHRYNEGTLARMRTEYVIPLSAKLNTYIAKLEQDKEASTSAAEVKRLEKEIDALHKQQIELAIFDEKLRHYADQRISLDLDDGVKVNYGKFGNLLAEVKSITGDKEE